MREAGYERSQAGLLLSSVVRHRHHATCALTPPLVLFYQRDSSACPQTCNECTGGHRQARAFWGHPERHRPAHRPAATGAHPTGVAHTAIMDLNHSRLAGGRPGLLPVGLMP